MDRAATVWTAVLIGAGGSCFAEMPTVYTFFERVKWPPNAGLKSCQEVARRIAVLEGPNENSDWPRFDAEKLFGYLELLERAAGSITGTWGSTSRIHRRR